MVTVELTEKEAKALEKKRAKANLVACQRRDKLASNAERAWQARENPDVPFRFHGYLVVPHRKGEEVSLQIWRGEKAVTSIATDYRLAAI